MWPFKKGDVQLVETYNNRTGLNSPFSPTPTRTCVKCGHVIHAARAVEVTVFGYSYGNGPTKEYYCEEDAPQWRVMSHSTSVRYRDRVQRIEYDKDGKVLSRKYTS